MGNLSAQSLYRYPFRNPHLSVEARVDNLINLLTPDEKVGMMMNASVAVPRLGIPAYNWWNEALHGVARAGVATVFPQAIGMAATWDAQELYNTFSIVSDEARAKYNDAIANGTYRQYYGLTFWTPNINIFRDPRWGRGMETYGEDPYLTSRMGVACVEGLQGNDPTYFKTHACAKHFAVHSGPEWNRHSYNADISDRDLWETYLPAFKALVIEANVQEVMCAYNALEGQPCCGSDKLLVNILRNTWDYKGIVTSDCGAINDFYRKGAHETAADAVDASVDAVLHGTDTECGTSYKALTEALKQGKIAESQIDVSLRRLLRARIQLGMFDPDSLVTWSKIPISTVDCEAHRQQALKMARESMTLLENKQHTLPLSKHIKTIAVVGDNANNKEMLWANYNGFPSATATILDGIKAKLPGAAIIYDQGCSLTQKYITNEIFDAVSTDGKQGFNAVYYNNVGMEGNPVQKEIIPKIYYHVENRPFAENVPISNFSAVYTGTFKSPVSGKIMFTLIGNDGCRLYVNGKLLIDNWKVNSVKVRTADWEVKKDNTYQLKIAHFQAGSDGQLKFHIAEKKPVDFAALKRKVQKADVIIYAGGLSPRLEGEEMPVGEVGFHGGDRDSIDLPAVQSNMLATLKSTGKPVVFVLCTGSAIALTNDIKNYDALLCAWYGGQAAGTAVADVLFGDYNPAGRLPVTFYTSLQQLENGLNETDPARRGFENYDMTGRTYRYMKSEPLYAFGYGLSYTTFAYGDAKLASESIKTGENVDITIPVANTGDRDGDEVVQVYVKRLNDNQAPLKSLRAFRRIHIAQGATQAVTLTLDPKSFEFYSPEAGKMVYKPGDYTVMYGSSSNDKDLKSLNLRVN